MLQILLYLLLVLADRDTTFQCQAQNCSGKCSGELIHYVWNVIKLVAKMEPITWQLCLGTDSQSCRPLLTEGGIHL